MSELDKIYTGLCGSVMVCHDHDEWEEDTPDTLAGMLDVAIKHILESHGS